MRRTDSCQPVCRRQETRRTRHSGATDTARSIELSAQQKKSTRKIICGYVLCASTASREAAVSQKPVKRSELSSALVSSAAPLVRLRLCRVFETPLYSRGGSTPFRLCATVCLPQDASEPLCPHIRCQSVCRRLWRFDGLRCFALVTASQTRSASSPALPRQSTWEADS